MNTQTARSKPLDRFVRWLMAARFLTFSLLLHLALLFVAGSIALMEREEATPDFFAGEDGHLMEPGDSTPPGDAPEPAPEVQITAPSLPVAAPLSAIVTVSQTSPWTATAHKLPVKGMSDLTKGGLSSLGNKLASSGSGGLMGKAGGTRTAMIFGRKIMANKLGVILDVSGSAHPHLAGAVTEIQAGFSDAILILYPGCGLTDQKGKSGHQIRKFSSLTKKDLEPGAAFVTTAAQLIDALRIDAFEAMTKRPSVRDTLFVSWYAGDGPGKGEGSYEKVIGQTQVAFEELLKRGMDTIYWFADFADDVDPKVAERLTSQMKSKRVKLHLHNFAGQEINPIVLEMSAKTGGTSKTDPAN